MERANRTLREELNALVLTCRKDAQEGLEQIIRHYNHERLHRSLGFKPPMVYYRGEPNQLDEARKEKLRQARHRRKERNLELRQRTLPLAEGGASTIPARAQVDQATNRPPTPGKTPAAKA